MFKDYYLIHDIPESSSSEEIKAAFKKQAFLWHPDINKSENAKIKMQNINEAYLILKDFEARERYNSEYKLFMRFRNHFTKTSISGLAAPNKGEYNYEIEDELLCRWVNNANRQSKNLVTVSLEELFGMTTAGVKAATKTFKDLFGFFVAAILLALLAFLGLLL